MGEVRGRVPAHSYEVEFRLVAERKEMIIMELIMARHIIEQTASMLDQVIPDWMTRVDRNKIDIFSCKKCIIGQLFPDEPTFYDGMDALRELVIDSNVIAPTERLSSTALGLNSGWHPASRFADLDLSDESDMSEAYLSMATLTLAWRQLIDDRASASV